MELAGWLRPPGGEAGRRKKLRHTRVVSYYYEKKVARRPRCDRCHHVYRNFKVKREEIG
jgi:hypothetical protein